MPCGGIFPCEPSEHPCWHCGATEPPADHVLIEWDSVIHGVCVADFLTGEEGKVVLNHKHAVVILIDGVETVLHKEGQMGVEQAVEEAESPTSNWTSPRRRDCRCGKELLTQDTYNMGACSQECWNKMRTP